ncbi:imidazole glycerol phosphate synthase subunit HisH [bacterium]|nr:imidazole glycerol phosphate synthase subunit HisH [bacterium]
MIALINYEAGNIHSVMKALEKCGATVKIVNNPKGIQKADKILLPGVGAFGRAMEALHRLKLKESLCQAAHEKPFLGICVGLQLLFESSEESPDVEGLAILKGHVKRFPEGLKIPHLGWNQVAQRRASPLWNDIPDDSFFCFANSYYGIPEDTSVIAGETEYNISFVSSIWKDTLFGCQFHPEKSQKWGLKILENFINL